MINAPKLVPYPIAVDVFAHGHFPRINASLIGPQAIEPTPRPAARSPMTNPVGAASSVERTALTMPGHVALELPAKMPYINANIHSGGNDKDNPQTTKTPKAVQAAARKRTVVTCHLSMSSPIRTMPITTPAFMVVIGAVVPMPDSPSTSRAYVGRYSDGAKYPRLWRRLITWKMAKERERRNL